MSNTTGVSYEAGTACTSRAPAFSPGGVPVAHIFNFLRCVLLCFVLCVCVCVCVCVCLFGWLFFFLLCLSSPCVPCVPYVDIVSGLPILDYPFGFL